MPITSNTRLAAHAQIILGPAVDTVHQPSLLDQASTGYETTQPCSSFREMRTIPPEDNIVRLVQGVNQFRTNAGLHPHDENQQIRWSDHPFVW